MCTGGGHSQKRVDVETHVVERLPINKSRNYATRRAELDKNFHARNESQNL